MISARMHVATLNGAEIVFSKLEEDPGFELFDASGGANTTTTVSGAKKMRPVLSWETQDLKTLLDAVPFAGYPITGVTTSKFIWYDAKQAEGGVFASGSVHRKNTLTKGLFVVEKISGQGNEAASASGKVYAIYDGTNAPVIRATGQALPGTVAQLSTLWVAGKATLDGTDLETQGWSFNIGPQVVSQYIDGEVFPRLAGILRYDGAAEVMTLNPAALDRNGKAEDSVLYLVKHDSNTGARVAAATAEHIAITIPLSYMRAGQASRSWAQESKFAVQLKAVYDGTNAFASVDTTAAVV